MHATAGSAADTLCKVTHSMHCMVFGYGHVLPCLQPTGPKVHATACSSPPQSSARLRKGHPPHWPPTTPTHPVAHNALEVERLHGARVRLDATIPGLVRIGAEIFI